MAAEKSKILVIGGTGYIGKFVVEASVKAGHPTFALVRESTGDLNDQESLVKAIKRVDVVISPVGNMQIPDQTKIIAAIKEAGNVKRFLPSEFGTDVDRHNAVEPACSTYARKKQIRRAIEAVGIPYTYVSCNCFAGYFLPTLVQPGVTAPPRDKKIGKSIEKTYFPEEQLLKLIQDSEFPISLILAINHSIFVNGDLTNFEIEQPFGVEASELYPDVKYTSVDEYLERFV
ncbi:hypothetical protein L1987_53269 [Smallanthus sonchifolius]|uniref:Uncharacterized protein n=1 Tax=Smallanthus sonchifolius TaxID=185202 RepID=A0ACB9EVE2_9ASTR|nr:hypothetical protein L1987_53269 [Smallanthus sonchifolius]